MLRDFSVEEFDILIQAGQSNSEGCGLGDVTVPFSQNGDIWYLNGDLTITPAREQIWGNGIVGNFALSFADEYVKCGSLSPGRKLLILRTAVGGTGFADKRWGLNDDLFLRMMEMIKTALKFNTKNKIVAFLWHQGETDAGFGVSESEHYKNLFTLINTVRTEFNLPKLPFIAGDFVSQWKMDNIKVCEPIIAAIKNVCADIGSAAFVETSELQSNDQRIGNGDVIHFCREALNQLGIQYYKAFVAITC